MLEGMQDGRRKEEADKKEKGSKAGGGRGGGGEGKGMGEGKRGRVVARRWAALPLIRTSKATSTGVERLEYCKHEAGERRRE